LPPI